mmetsp:Transcript_27134/g.38468  ORF Transcript_27134/g.38468 Transcript_27134/m.38468 type:complete len:178 (+) Transcript_27134:22-555(+)|eukprot:CAMPEP_0175088224 /NCGR_PEP_ID=MMETSP0086_2-20121207/138_1 /TAXON_ID=136419 /ORGANISM="Unknown Unknown, Strain D1" /LENGTH=177 /DNA_ID=CAMNT_0016360651 /DNA_START=21 /DNA_END=554 /DNA_ORIENTATION=+
MGSDGGILFQLFLVFSKIGLTGFGGGVAFLPLLEKELVEARQWLSPEEFTDIIALGNASPGLIATKIAGHVGFKHGGVPGLLISTSCIGLPGVIMLVVMASAFASIKDSPRVTAFLMGVRPATCALLIATLLRLLSSSVTDSTQAVIAIAGVVALYYFKAAPLVVIVCSGVVGLMLY